MGLTLVTPASSPAVSLAEAKAWCRVDGTASDSAVQLALAAAIAATEELLGISLAAQTWLYVLDAFADTIELPRGPVVSLDSFTYVDPAGGVQDVDADIFTLDLVSKPQRIVRNPDCAWPDAALVANAIALTFTAGGTGVAPQLKLAILSLAARWFDNRTTGEIPASILDTIMSCRQLRI